LAKKLFLLTNDDGYEALGIRVLADILGELGEVVIVAPQIEQSACSHSITLHRPLRINAYGSNNYAVDGTPTDCVLLASQRLLDRLPDAIFSGINHGPNLGDDVLYSGTVAGAMEGSLLGVRSMSISSWDLERIADRQAQQLLSGLIGQLLTLDWPRDMFLNINLPKSDIPIRGVRMTTLGRRHYAETVIEKTDPRGKVYYWIGGVNPRWYGKESSDFRVVAEGYITVTPLQLDMTHYPSLEEFKRFETSL
jgi:5'-nucleotidase